MERLGSCSFVEVREKAYEGFASPHAGAVSFFALNYFVEVVYGVIGDSVDTLS